MRKGTSKLAININFYGATRQAEKTCYRQQMQSRDWSNIIQRN